MGLASEHDVGFIAMKPFAGGAIRDASLALRYLYQFDNVLPDPGVEKVGEVEQIAITEGPWGLDDEDRRRIAEIKGQLGTHFCRQCGYCGPCPRGVIIHGVLYLRRLHTLWPPDHYFNWAYVTHAVESATNCVECGECEKKCPFGLPIREMIKKNVGSHERVTGEWRERQG